MNTTRKKELLMRGAKNPDIKSTRRTVLKTGTVGLLLAAGLPAAAAKSTTDERETLNKRFNAAIAAHGKPEISGQRRWVDGELLYNTGGPTVSPSEIPNNGDVVLTMAIEFEDGTQQEQIYSQLRSGGFSVEYLGSMYNLVVGEDDQTQIRQTLDRIDRKLSADIEEARKERFPKKAATEGDE